jgi:outer membrane receptor protein involved in Fe transport
MMAATSLAQTNVTGTAFGEVKPGPGITVLIEGVDGGVRRTLTPDSSGKFNASALTAGSYRATVLRDGKPTGQPVTFDVLIGQGTAVSFASGATQTIEVTGRVLTLDMTSSTTGATFTARQLDALPIQRSVDAIIQLAPNTTRIDSRYSGGASFGGGAASENSYYINGYPITNPLTQLGSSELPFGALGQAQVQSGGFGVEFGRSIGGVVNLISKSGGNRWEVGLAGSYSPSGFRADRKNIFWEKTGNPQDGLIYQAKRFDRIEEYTVSGYLGGPLIQDKLFMFVALETRDRTSGLVTGFNGTNTLANQSKLSGWTDRVDTTDRYLAKFDWNITDNHRLELTNLGDKYLRTESLSGFDYSTFTRNGAVVANQSFINDGANFNNLGVGADTRILKYTGYLTDNLTIQVLAGKSKTPHPQDLVGYDPTVPEVTVEGTGAYPGFLYPNLQTQSGNLASATFKDTTKGERFDLEYKLGKHTIRAGVDRLQLSSLDAGEAQAGGRLLQYASTDDPDFQDNGMTATISAGAPTLQAGGRYYFGTETFFSTVSSAFSTQNAAYIEDKWQFTPNLLLTFGLRNEQYQNKDNAGQVFLKVKDQLTPRVAFAWDALGDKSTKIFGSAGRYAVQIPSSIALRGANSSLFTDQIFAYTGVNADGTPQGRVNLGPAFSTNNEYGLPKDLTSVSAQDMKPNMQDELILGIEKALNRDLNVGARLTYRRLASTIDDYCDTRAFAKWANDNGVTDANGDPISTAAGNVPFSCAAFNPGIANTFLLDFNGDGVYERVNLSKADLGFQTAKRTYAALDLFAEHPLRNGWYGKINYTYSKNKGNTEGQTNSDLGQTDVSQTVTWDHPELAVNSYGYLPNDRRHQIKAYGFMQVMQGVQVGANFLAASGRPRNCLGRYPNGDAEFGTYISYQAVYFYCGGNAAPRGSYGNLPWDVRLDMNATWRPAGDEGLAFRADLFNLFNKQTVESRVERYEQNSLAIRNSYGRVLTYTAPRSFRFTVTYDKKF